MVPTSDDAASAIALWCTFWPEGTATAVSSGGNCGTSLSSAGTSS